MEESTKTTMIALTPKNYHLWIKELQGIAEKAKVWAYVDPDGTKAEPQEGEYPDVSDYQVPQPQQLAGGVGLSQILTKPADKYSELSDVQKEEYKMDISMFKMKEKQADKVAQGLRIVDNALKHSARSYIPPNKMAGSVREIVKILASRYKRSDDQVMEQLHEQFQVLKNAPVKGKIEAWVADWENIKGQIVDMNVTGIFGSDTIFINEFLQAGKKWAPNFCENWVMQHRAAKTTVEFYETTREYRLAVEAFLVNDSKSSRGQANAATLQGQTQEQTKKKGQSKASQPEDGQSKEEKERAIFKDKKCVCGVVHLFRDCPYIVSTGRQSGWKEDKVIRNDIRQKIQKNIRFFVAIKKLTNTNILEGMTEDSVKSCSQKPENKEEKETNQSYSFANVTSRSNNPLHSSVIFDSGCDNPLTFDKSRFVGEIIPVTIDSEMWVDTPDGAMLVLGHGTMRVKGLLNGQPRELLFENTAYIPDSNVTLVSANKLKNKGFFWDMFTDTLIDKKTGQKICDIEEHFGLPTLEFNQVLDVGIGFANSVQPRDSSKATPWRWHLRLGHCRPEVIKHLKKLEDVTVLKDESAAAPKAMQCMTCAVSKMHRLINRAPSGRAIKPFQVLHFDLTINNRGFDGTSCIAHFTDEFTSFCWVYPLTDHKKKTLIPVFKSLVNQCDRAGLSINSMVTLIRTRQETSIGNKLEEWITQQGIGWSWSAKNTPEQNGISERFGALLTEKARCIREHAKLPEDLFPECYMAAAYLMNRTPSQALEWDSPLVKLQKLTNQPIRHELAHLKVFGCKAYSLLKGADAPPKSEKLKPRAFVGYLIGYDSTNIFRVWDPKKGDVSGYRDVIFDEDELYNTYVRDQYQLLEEDEKTIEVITPRPAIQELDSEDEEWLEMSISRRVEKLRIDDQLQLDDQLIVTEKTPSTPKQLNTPDETPFSTPYQTHFTGDNSRFSNDETSAPQTQTNQLPETGQTPLNVTEVVRRGRRSQGINEANIIQGKRSRKPNVRFANIAWSSEEMSKIPQFHAAFMAGTMTRLVDSQSNAALKAGITKKSEMQGQIHADNLPDPPSHWRAMLRHLHYEGFKNAAIIEWEALTKKATWEIVDQERDAQKPIPLKWVFTYKTNSDGYLTKYKARLVVRGDLQQMDGQDVYAATLAFKVFRALMALVAAFRLKTRQLDAVNAFLNAPNDEEIYCYMPDGFKISKKVLKVKKALYGQRKSPLLWLRMLTIKCLELGLKQVPGEPCLFTNEDGIILFFYVDDIVMAYRADKEEEIEAYVLRFKEMFEIRDMGALTYFLGVRIIQDNEKGTVHLVQDAYMDKLAKEYEVGDELKKPETPLSLEELGPYEGEIDSARMHLYRKKVGSICYPAIMTRPDIAKSASRLAEFLTNPGPQHMRAADHCLRYLYATKYLSIKFSASGGGEMMAIAEKDNFTYTNKQVFEATADASFANYPDRKSGEGYTFKLFGGMIDWAARKQLTVTTSTTEAELLSMLHAGKELIWWTNLFEKLNFDPDQEITIYNDNFQTIRILTSEIARTDTKLRHIDIAQCWLRQSVQNGQLMVDYLPTNRMISDGLTKLLSPQKHGEFVKQLGLVNAKDLVTGNSKNSTTD
jgi:hypothetical protein